MEEIIQILIFVGAMVIAVIGQNAKSKKKPMTASPQEVLEDMFPEINVQGEEKVVLQNVRQPVSKPKKTVAPSKQERHRNKNTSAPIIATPTKEKEISLKSRKEARRAFIYSEIFNRKY